MVQIAQRVCAAREKAGLTRQELAARLRLSYWAVAKYEEGTRIPPSEVLRQIAKATATTTDYLLALTDDPRPSEVREGAATKLYEGTEGLTPEELQEWRGYADWLRERRKRKGPSHNSHPETPQT